MYQVDINGNAMLNGNVELKSETGVIGLCSRAMLIKAPTVVFSR